MSAIERFNCKTILNAWIVKDNNVKTFLCFDENFILILPRMNYFWQLHTRGFVSSIPKLRGKPISVSAQFCVKTVSHMPRITLSLVEILFPLKRKRVLHWLTIRCFCGEVSLLRLMHITKTISIGRDISFDVLLTKIWRRFDVISTKVRVPATWF